MKTKLLNGLELAGFIKERQAKEVRSLRQAFGIAPKLAIVRANDDPIVDTYMRLKQGYGEDILVDVDIYAISQDDIFNVIDKLNKDGSVHGIIVQLPLPDRDKTREVLNAVLPQKDVDGLHSAPVFDAATPTAINWLLSGYNIDLKGKNILIIGQGRLVGAPLARMWRQSGLNVVTADRSTGDMSQLIKEADIVVTATGSPNLVKSQDLKAGAVIVDAGVATDKNGLVGDVAADVRNRLDITITPEKGGVGPLTVCALFENVIRAARATIKPLIV